MSIDREIHSIAHDLLLITYVELHFIYGVQLDFHYIPAVV
jgi:hypothetical protein